MKDTVEVRSRHYRWQVLRAAFEPAVQVAAQGGCDPGADLLQFFDDMGPRLHVRLRKRETGDSFTGCCGEGIDDLDVSRDAFDLNSHGDSSETDVSGSFQGSCIFSVGVAFQPR